MTKTLRLLALAAVGFVAVYALGVVSGRPYLLRELLRERPQPARPSAGTLTALGRIPPLVLPKPGAPSPQLSSVEFHLKAVLPSETDIMVYKFVPANATREDGIELARKLGMVDPVVDETPAHAGLEAAVMLNSGGYLLRYEKGSGKFQFLLGGYPGEGFSKQQAATVPSDERVAAIASEFLESRDLLPEGYGIEKVGVGLSMGFGDEELVASKKAMFTRKVNGREVAGKDSITVEVGAEERIVGVSYFHKRIRPYEVLPLKTVDEAIADLKSGKGSLQMSPNTTDVEIFEIRLKYFSDPGPPGDQPYLVPVYEFKGSTSWATGGEPFAATVEALRRD